jgi:predicted GH43/DUF377 family glycosyl hydrolase
VFIWRKRGKLFDPTSIAHADWMVGFAQGPATLVLDNIVRVYFSCRPEPDARNQYVSYAAYVDLDRDDLSRVVSISARPILELGGRGTFDEFGTYPVSVIRDGDCIRAYYGGWTRCASVPFNVAIGYAISRDGGVRFDKSGAGPVLAPDLEEPFVISGPKIRRFGDRWYLWYIAGTKWIATGQRPEPVYRIRMATSADGRQWQRLHRELIPPRLEPDECQASPDVVFANGKYHMFFCYRYSLGYRGREKGYRIGYASSTDLVTWQRDDGKAGIDVADSGWDSETISYPHVFELDGHMLMLYLGNEVGRHGFGLAVLEGDLS